MQMTPHSFRRLLGATILLGMTTFSHAQTTLVTDVHGYTVNSDHEMVKFSALQFTDGKVDRLYAEGEALPEDDTITRIDGQGRTLLSGLIDAHGHILSYGLSLLRVDLTGTRSEQEAVERIRAFRERNGNLEWIQGRGWNQVLWDSNEFPSAASLDEFFGDTPV